MLAGSKKCLSACSCCATRIPLSLASEDPSFEAPEMKIQTKRNVGKGLFIDNFLIQSSIYEVNFVGNCSGMKLAPDNLSFAV